MSNDLLDKLATLSDEGKIEYLKYCRVSIQLYI